MTRSYLNFPNLNRASVGFDKMFEELTSQFENSQSSGYPPYNIIQHDEDTYEISLAVAGFTMDDLVVEQEKNILKIEGSKPDLDENVNYLHKGVASRSFKRSFTLADHVEVSEAWLEYGMLTIKLVRYIPENLQPKRIQLKVK